MKLLLIILQAMLLTEGEPAVVYHMPFTEIGIHVEYTHVKYEAGPFAKFAEEMLNAENAVMETEDAYYLDKISTGTRTTADANRVYKILPEKGIDLQLLALRENGTLYGYNVAVEHAEHNQEKKSIKRPKTKSPEVMALLEDGVKAQSLREQALSVQHQILQIREARLYLLLGEGESQPTDGNALTAMIQEMNSQEEKLTRLFTGTMTMTQEESWLYYAPTFSTQATVARFNESKGIVGAEEEGLPINIIITTTRMHQNESAMVDKKGLLPSPIYYNLPGTAKYSVWVGDEEYVKEKQIQVAQLGVAVPLTRDLFKPGTKTHITFNRKTGNIESIRKD